MDEERWRWVGGDSEDHCGRCAFHQNKGRRGRSERPLRKRYLREGGRENRQGFHGAGVHLRVIFIYILTCSFMTWRMKRGWWRDRDRVGRNVLVTTRQPGRLHRTRGETSRGCSVSSCTPSKFLDAARCQGDLAADMTRFRTSSHHWWDWLWCSIWLNLAGLEGHL